MNLDNYFEYQKEPYCNGCFKRLTSIYNKTEMQSNENSPPREEIISNSTGISKVMQSNESSPAREITTSSIGFSKDLFNSKGK